MRLYPPGTRKGNKTYIARFYAGRHYEEDLETTEGRVARRRARQLVAAAKEDAKKAKTEAGGQASKPKTFKECAERYKAARGLRPVEVERVDRLVGELGPLPLLSVVADDIARAANELLPGTSNATKNREVYTPASSILHYGAENEWCPYKRIRRLKEAEVAMRRIPDDKMHVLIEASAGPVRKLLVFLFLQGWRISEALRLRKEHVNFKNGTLLAHVKKARKWKPVPMNPDVAAALRAGEWYGDKAFPWASVQSVNYHLAKLETATGIHFTTHMARHAFGGGNREEGATSVDLVDIGTWTSPKSTERYQSATGEHAQKLIRRRGLGETVGTKLKSV